MIYLATPYTHKDPHIRELRYEIAMELQARLIIEHRLFVYSPIVMCHVMSDKFALPANHEFWQKFDQHFIDSSTKVIFAIIDGWKTSKGMKSEYAYAKSKQKPIDFILMYDGNLWFCDEKYMDKNPWA